MIHLYYFMANYYLWLAKCRPTANKKWATYLEESIKWMSKVKAILEILS